jgi:hypothetical protein
MEEIRVGQRTFSAALDDLRQLLERVRQTNDVFGPSNGGGARSPLRNTDRTLHFLVIYDLIHALLEEQRQWSATQRQAGLAAIGRFLTTLDVSTGNQGPPINYLTDPLQELYDALTHL